MAPYDARRERGHFERSKLVPLEKSLPTILLDSTYKSFCSARMKLVWLSHAHLDLLYEINQMAQITEQIITEEKAEVVRLYNNSVKMENEDN